MQKTIPSVVALATALFTGFNTQAQGSVQFVHLANSSNISSHQTSLNHISLKAGGVMYPQVTHNHNPNWAQGVYVNQYQGVWKQNGNWTIYNQSQDTFADNSHYNVLIPGDDTESWKHISSAANSSNNYTLIDHPAINGDSSAVILITSAYDTHFNKGVFGVSYLTSQKKWAIINEGGIDSALALGSAFHVSVVKKQQLNLAAYVHTTTYPNTSTSITRLDHPQLNNNPNAIINITQNLNPFGGNDVYNNNNVGVYYTGTHWSIYHEDYTKHMPLGANFNVVFHDPTLGNADITIAHDLFKVYPNPTNQSKTVKVSFNKALTETAHFEIFNMNGSLVWQQVVKPQAQETQELKVHNLPKGVYSLKCHSQDQSTSKLLIIN